MTPEPTTADRDAAWNLLRRRSAYVGENRAALLRFVAIGLFYLVELLAQHGATLGFLQLEDRSDFPATFHERITMVVAGWVMLGVGTLVLVRGRTFTPRLSYVSTTIDVVMLTSVLVVAGGPGSPAVLGYFVLLALGLLRCNLPLMRFTTAAVLAGYVVLLGAAKLSANVATVPRYEQLMTLIALAVTGIVLDRFLALARTLPDDYARFLERERGREVADDD